MKAATNLMLGFAEGISISIHAAREGGDALAVADGVPATFISIHAAREGGDPTAGTKTPRQHISIHAAREGGDVLCLDLAPAPFYFNPRRP